MKLQDAYAAETGAAGSWSVIGYIGPGDKDGTKASGTSTYKYTDEFAPKDKEKNTTMVGDLSEITGTPKDDDGDDAWKAEAKTALNDCKIQSTWEVRIAKAGDGSTLKYNPVITNKAGTDKKSDCESLTANFSKIGK